MKRIRSGKYSYPSGILVERRKDALKRTWWYVIREKDYAILHRCRALKDARTIIYKYYSDPKDVENAIVKF